MTTPDQLYPTVAGFCPMGCGQTLTLAPDTAVACSNPECIHPRAVRDLLANPQTDHVVMITDDGQAVVQHPLRERAEGSLFSCSFAVDVYHAAGQPTPPPEPGTYVVTGPADSWSWERLG